MKEIQELRVGECGSCYPQDSRIKTYAENMSRMSSLWELLQYTQEDIDAYNASCSVALTEETLAAVGVPPRFES